MRKYIYKVVQPIILNNISYEKGDRIIIEKDLSNHIFYHLGYIKFEDKKEVNKKLKEAKNSEKAKKSSSKKTKSKKIKDYETKVIDYENK